MNRLTTHFLIVLVLLGLASPVAAQADYESVTGRLLGEAGEALAGHRVVFRAEGASESFISKRSNDAGEYVAYLPSGLVCQPVALIAPGGRRIELAGHPSVTARPDAQLDVRRGGQAAAPTKPAPAPVPVPVPVPVAQEPENVSIVGRVADTRGPLRGYQVVFTGGDSQSFVSEPSGRDGEYRASLPAGGDFTPSAVIMPGGTRVSLAGETALRATAGARRDILLAAPEPAPAPTPAPTPAPASPPVPGVGFTAVTGKLTDATGSVLKGYRVVFRLADAARVFVSLPSDAAGEYVVLVPDGSDVVPVAEIAPDGWRIALGEQPSLRADEGARRDIGLPSRLPPEPNVMVRRFLGSDRLFASFIEDVPVVDKARFEVQADLTGHEFVNRAVSRVIAAFRLPGVHQIEVGGRLGYGSVDFPAGFSDESGATDLDLWGKLRLGRFRDGQNEFGMGAVLTVPMGDEDAGLGFDAFRAKLFGSFRRSYDWGVLAAHFGIRAQEDGMVGATVLEAEVAPAAGVAVLFPLWDEVIFVGEATVEGESFKGADTDASILGGVNWRFRDRMVLRVAAGAGLTDGAPDARLIVGYSNDF